MARKDKTNFCLVALDNEGEWNVPLLENAAIISNAGCVFASTENTTLPVRVGQRPVFEVLQGFQRVVACEIVRDSVSVFDFPAPRERTAVIVGNELTGIPRSLLKKADSVVSIPMIGSGMSSVNVAVSAAITLYVLTQDIARIKKVRGRFGQRSVDVLINAPSDPHELGSLLRSAWAFGWKRVFINDVHNVWFSQDRMIVRDSRAAARRFKNPITVLSINELNMGFYDHVLVADVGGQGERLSRYHVPDVQNLLVVYGCECDRIGFPSLVDRVLIDFLNKEEIPRFRHQGSVLLAYVANLLRGKK